MLKKFFINTLFGAAAAAAALAGGLTASATTVEDVMAVFEIADQILERSEKACDDLNFDTEAFTDFTKASKRIVFKLVNKKMNEKLLESIPYTDYMDLAMVYYYMLPETRQEKGSGDCGATILIQNSHLKLWKVKKEEVEQVAKENTPKLLPAAIIGMTQMLREMLGEDKFPEELDAESLPMYILSNEKRQNGAAAMAYPETIGNFANACGKNVYIIPSSVHELILVPETGMEKDLNEMVCEVNRTQLDPKDVLSDHVYYYDRQEKQLTGLLRQVTSYC